MSLKAKLNAAKAALEYVEDGDTIGVGSGSTVNLFIEELAKSGKRVTAVPTSLDTLGRLAQKKIPVTTLAHVDGRLRLAVDGADQVDPQLNLVKGGGGALTREKIVAYSAELFVVVVDGSKLVARLGVGFPVPVEFLYDAYPLLARKVKEELGCTLLFREGQGKLAPIISDNGLALGGLVFEQGVADPRSAEDRINVLPGVLENGLFTKQKNMVVVVGGEEGCRVLER